MAERELAILLKAKNMASGPIKSVTKDIGTMDRVAGRAGKGVRTLGSNLKNLATGAVIGGVIGGFAAIKSGLDSLAERENVIAATEAAIKATGGAAKISAGQIRTWSEDLERATGAAVDDKAIQAAATTLLRFGVVGEAAFKRTLAAGVDLGAGMKKGPEAGAKLLGKALADPAKAMGALRKAGIILTAAEEKRIKQLVKGNKTQEAQAVVLAAVEKRYKGAAAGSAGPYTKALNLLADASEDAKMALAEGFLPILTKVSDRLSKALANPKTIEDIRTFGKGLADGFDKALDAASQIPWGTIKDAMGMAGKGAKAAFDLFNGLPPWVQTAVVTGWGLNKLTGGAVGGVIGELGKGLIKGVLGMNAGVVNIKAGAVTGAGGGVGGGAPTKGGALGRVAGAVGKVFLVGAAVGVFAELTGILSDKTAENKAGINDLTDKTNRFAPKATDAALRASIAGIDATQKRLYNELSGEGLAFSLNIDGVRDAIQKQEDTLRTQLVANLRTAQQAVVGRGELRGEFVGAVTSIKPPVFQAQTTVTVNVTAASIGKTVTVANRMGKQNGSYGGGRRSGALVY